MCFIFVVLWSKMANKWFSVVWSYINTYVRAYTRTNQCIICLRYIQQNLFPNTSWPTEELSPALGQPCGKTESPESPASCCCKLPMVFRSLCTFYRLAYAPLLSAFLLWISANTLHLSFTSLLSQVHPSWSCSPTFICLFCFSCPFLSVPLFPLISSQHLVCLFPLQT